MGNNVLSQEEIDALLRGRAVSAREEPSLSENEKDALGEIGNISMGTAATTLSMLLNRRVQITIPRVSVTTPQEIASLNPMPFIIVEVGYTEGLQGRNLLVIRTGDGSVIADLMMGHDGLNPDPEISELTLSALSEAMNQMMGSAATSLSTIFNRTIVISPPSARVIDLVNEPLDAALNSDEYLARISFRMTVENLIDSELMLLLQVGFAKDMVALLQQEAEPPQSAPPKSQEVAMRQPPVASSAPPPNRRATPVAVQPVEFAPLPPEASRTASAGNLGLLMDVPLQLTVELGRTRKTIKEIIELGPGSIFELDRVAGEPVDIFVNGKLIAKGEVVVIDDNFGVRVTDIVSVIDRVSNLQ
jgi:flagellar motor switch protein FliN/FliY